MQQLRGVVDVGQRGGEEQGVRGAESPVDKPRQPVVVSLVVRSARTKIVGRTSTPLSAWPVT